jgi:DNA-binding NarL/FixJ family response regulator
MTLEPLTRREREILELLVLGLENQEIADTLCIALGTVEGHLHNIFRKFRVHKRVKVVVYAICYHIVEVKPEDILVA